MTYLRAAVTVVVVVADDVVYVLPVLLSYWLSLLGLCLQQNPKPDDNRCRRLVPVSLLMILEFQISVFLDSQ